MWALLYSIYSTHNEFILHVNKLRHTQDSNTDHERSTFIAESFQIIIM